MRRWDLGTTSSPIPDLSGRGGKGALSTSQGFVAAISISVGLFLCSRSIWTLVDHPLGCKQPVLLYLGHILLGLGKDVMDAAVPKIPVGLRPFTCQETAGCPLLLLVFKGSQMKFSRFPPALVPAASNVLPVSAFQLPLLVKLLFWSCFPSAS